jgi:NAD(P)H-dependent FMN reductase
MMTIFVIIGSTRQNRFSEKPAQWILQQLRAREAIESRLPRGAEQCPTAYRTY